MTKMNGSQYKVLILHKSTRMSVCVCVCVYTCLVILFLASLLTFWKPMSLMGPKPSSNTVDPFCSEIDIYALMFKR